jgi:hypothetical protein
MTSGPPISWARIALHFILVSKVVSVRFVLVDFGQSARRLGAKTTVFQSENNR